MRSMLLCVMLASLSGCWSAVSYVAQPTRIGDPVSELQKLLDTGSTYSGCIAKGRATAEQLTYQYVCSQAASSSVAKVADLATVEIESLGSYYRVVGKHATKRPDFEWIAQAREDAELFADSLVALARLK